MRVCLILLSSSPSPPLCRPPPLSPFPVFLTFPTLVVPVHSIRLEYGCVVVDTCSVWSVSQCCRVMIWCSSWCHRTRSTDWKSGDKRWKGWPRSLKKQTLVPISRPYSFLKNHFWNFPILHSATLGSFSGYDNPWTVLYVFSLMISCHALTYKCRKGGRVVVTSWLWAYTHFLPTVVHWVISTRSSIKAVHSLKTDIFILVRVENNCLYLFKPHKSLKAGGTFSSS